MDEEIQYSETARNTLRRMLERIEIDVQEYVIWLCDLCVKGAGGECHVPGCAMWMKSAPDVPLTLARVDTSHEIHVDVCPDCGEPAHAHHLDPPPFCQHERERFVPVCYVPMTHIDPLP